MDIKLTAVDRVEITTVVDNYSDVLLPGNAFMQRPPMAVGGKISSTTLLAEHGLSLLVTVFCGEDSRSVLLDTGYTNVAVPHNLNQLDISLKDLEAVVFSHGHMDHTGALQAVLERAGAGTRVIMHPDAFLPKFYQIPSLPEISFPEFPAREAITQWGGVVTENKEPLLLCDGTLLVTGEVPRITGYEEGMPGAVLREGDVVVPDTFKDDQSLVIRVKDRGIAVISGCAHSGIVNSVMYARELAGEDNVCAVIGGFHLSGADLETKVYPTIDALKEINPDVLCPMHCTGFDTINRMAAAMPDAFALNSVGSKIIL